MSDILVSFAGGNASSGPIFRSAPGAKAGQQIISIVSTGGAANLLPNFVTAPGSLAFVPVEGGILQVSTDLTGVNMIALLRG